MTLSTATAEDVGLSFSLSALSGATDADTIAQYVLAWDPTLLPGGDPLQASYSDGDWTIYRVNGSSVSAGSTVNLSYGSLTVSNGGSGQVDTITFTGSTDASDANNADDQSQTVTVSLRNVATSETVNLSLDVTLLADTTFEGTSSSENIVGGAGNDTMDGGAGNDTIDGLGGNDTINGDAGNDRLYGNADDDSLSGGAGADSLDGGTGNDTLIGDGQFDTFNDTLIGGEGNDSLLGGKGNDSLTGGAGNDTIDGGAGTDTAVFDGSITSGADIGDGGAGTFTVTVEGTDNVDNVETLKFDNVTLSASTAQDIVADVDLVAVAGGSDNDTYADGIIRWDPSNADPLTSCDDADWTIVSVDGTAVSDGSVVQVDLGTITVSDAIGGDSTIDTITFTASSSLANEASNVDDTIQVVIANAANSDDTTTLTINLTVDADTAFTGTSGSDKLVGGSDGEDFDGGNGADGIRGGGGNDTIDAGAGNDFVTGDDGDDLIVGGDGNDGIFAGGSTKTGNDSIRGDAGDDEIGGGLGNDLLIGGGTNSNRFSVNDTLSDDGKDTIYGGAGDDTVVGGDWDDGVGQDGVVAAGEVGTGTDANVLWGGAGNDDVYGAGGADRIGGGAGNDDISGGAGNDTIYGGIGAAAISNDTIDGGAGSDSIYGGDGDDSILGGTGNDLIYGGSGDDVVDGGAGDDALYGGTGDDTITAGDGDDTLTGAAGADIFIFSDETNAVDIIEDFDLTQDVIDLSAILAASDTNTGDGDGDFETLVEVKGEADETTIDGKSGVLISLGETYSLFIVGVTLSDLTSDHFNL